MHSVSYFNTDNDKILLVLSSNSRIKLERNDESCKQMVSMCKEYSAEVLSHPFYFIHDFKVFGKDKLDRRALMDIICKHLDAVGGSVVSILDIYENEFDGEWLNFFKSYGFQYLEDEVVFRPTRLES